MKTVIHHIMRNAIQIGILLLLLPLGSCGIFGPQDGTVKVVGTIVGVVPSDIDGIRLVALLPDPLSEELPGSPQFKAISEVVMWIDSGFVSQHHASGDSTTIRTTFTLHPDEYAIGFQKMYGGDSWQYVGLGPESSKWVTVLPRKEITVRLFHEFQ